MSGVRLRLYELVGLLLRRPIRDPERRAFWWALAIVVPLGCVLAVLLHLVAGGGVALLLASGAVLAVVLSVPACALARRRYRLEEPAPAEDEIAADAASSRV
jgi:hypothetical protein